MQQRRTSMGPVSGRPRGSRPSVGRLPRLLGCFSRLRRSKPRRSSGPSASGGGADHRKFPSPSDQSAPGAVVAGALVRSGAGPSDFPPITTCKALQRGPRAPRAETSRTANLRDGLQRLTMPARDLGSRASTRGGLTLPSRIVLGSKALRHLLPELVVPIDREYTQRFFGWANPTLQNFPERCFREAFAGFAAIAREANPAQYVGRGWHTSKTKVIDNAIVGLWCWVTAKARAKPRDS